MDIIDAAAIILTKVYEEYSDPKVYDEYYKVYDTMPIIDDLNYMLKNEIRKRNDER